MTPYRDLFERSIAGLYVVDERGRVLDCNDAFARLAGLPSRSALLEGSPVVLPPVAETQASGWLLPSGARVWVERAESPLADGTRAGTAIDRTEQRATESSLSDRARQAGLLAAIGQALTIERESKPMLERCAATLAAHFEAEVVEIWGLDEDGKPRLDASSGPLASKDATEAVLDLTFVERALRQPFTIEPTLAELSPFGREQGAGLELTKLAAHPIAAGDRVLGVACMLGRATSPLSVLSLAPVTVLLAAAIERSRAEEALRKSELGFQSLVEEAPDGVLAFDPMGRFELFNRAAERISGYAASEMLGKSFATSGIIAPESLARVIDEFARTLEGDLRPPFELDIVRKDGTRVTVESIGRGIERGGVITVQATLRDVTARRRDVGQRVDLEEQLRQAQKMEAVGRLAGGVAHDFNNLLAVILNYGSIVLSELGEQDPIRQDVEEIQKAANRAAALTRQLLIFSRKEVAQPAVLDLNEVVADMEKLLRRTIGEDIALVTSFASQLRRVLADPGQMQQVVMNLAINARDAMPSGGRLLIETSNVDVSGELALRLGLRPERYARLSVVDTGLGMSEEVISRAFEPFFTTKPKGKGTGLGLSTVYGIVLQAKGGVEILSRPGEGARFDIFLPETERPERTAEPTGVLRPVRRARKDGRVETLLVAEDEDAVRALTCRILSRYGFMILEARGPGEALLASERHDGVIDLLLTDVVMPQMSGKELAERLVKERPTMRVLYMSGYSGDVIAQHAIEEGTIALLPKPFTEESLILRVREILDGPS